MRSEEVADYVEETIRRLEGRILGVGHEQYADEDEQRFETVPFPELFQMAFEELDDLIVYICMIRIRLSRLQARMG